MNKNQDFSELWTERYRPAKLDDILLSKETKDYFNEINKTKVIPHLLFYGNAGGGKSSLARIIVNDILKCQYLYINASDENSVDTVRGKISNFVQTKSLDGNIKVVILDEMDGMGGIAGHGASAQQALRNILEEYSAYSRFILTCNYIHKIIEPIMSRVQTFYVCPEQNDYLKRCLEILKTEKIILPADQKPTLLKLIEGYYPDLRKCINELQKFSITGTFKPPERNTDQEISNIAKTCLDMLMKKDDVVAIRKYIIESEKVFKADYQILLKNLFEEVFNSSLDALKKRTVLIVISEALYFHQIVLDKEINYFATLIKIGNVL